LINTEGDTTPHTIFPNVICPVDEFLPDSEFDVQIIISKQKHYFTNILINGYRDHSAGFYVDLFIIFELFLLI